MSRAGKFAFLVLAPMKLFNMLGGGGGGGQYVIWPLSGGGGGGYNGKDP